MEGVEVCDQRGAVGIAGQAFAIAYVVIAAAAIFALRDAIVQLTIAN
jgi:hypothetical protein